MTCQQITAAVTSFSFLKVYKISFTGIEKFLFSGCRRNSKAVTFSGSHRKNQTRRDKKQTKNEKHRPVTSMTHTCTGTINSRVYDSDLTITTSTLTSSAP
jgi:hypothetical protein